MPQPTTRTCAIPITPVSKDGERIKGGGIITTVDHAQEDIVDWTIIRTGTRRPLAQSTGQSTDFDDNSNARGGETNNIPNVVPINGHPNADISTARPQRRMAEGKVYRYNTIPATRE